MPNPSMLRIGYHVSIAGSISMAFGRAHSIGCTTMQIFVGNPRSWNFDRIAAGEAKQFIAESKKFEIRPVFAHMPYLPNLASPNDAVYSKSIRALESAIENCRILGIKYIVMHLGSHLGKGRDFGLRHIEDAINGVDTKGVTLLLENEAGQRNAMGSSLDELAEVYDSIDAKEKGFCVDTCHAFAAGYDIRNPEVLDKISDSLGIGNIKLVHLNDAKFGLGSHLDRHEDIGHGHIGAAGIRNVLHAFAGRPFIMETPWKSEIESKAELRLVASLAQ
ncbi:MAG: deoxyribonuclease IV [Candidatus Micrarchaeaceae archaeon]